MPSLVVVGAQWGDEGKGKIIDLLTAKSQHIVRAQGGNNAGHTIVFDKEEFKLHLIPSGILHPHTQCYITSGTVIDPEVLLDEVRQLEDRGIDVKGRLWISPGAHVIMPYHKQVDQLLEERKGALSIGTTGRGIGPCYTDKASRVGIRIGVLIDPELLKEQLESILPLKNEELTKVYGGRGHDLQEILKEYQRYGQQIKGMVRPVEQTIYKAIKGRKNVLFEGAQGTFLDLNSGTYPYVTSSNTVAAGVCVGAGIGPGHVDHVLGVVKAYTTRVGNGPFPTQVSDNEIFVNHERDREKGTTTGRIRRIGWFDAVLIKEAVRLNSLDSIALTKLDVLDRLAEIKICTQYRLDGKSYDFLPYLTEDLSRVEPQYITMSGWQCSTADVDSFSDLPAEAKAYIQQIEDLCQVPVSLLSLGPERERTLILGDVFTSKEKQVL